MSYIYSKGLAGNPLGTDIPLADPFTADANYPNENVNFFQLMMVGKLTYTLGSETAQDIVTHTADSFTDKALKAVHRVWNGIWRNIYARFTDINNYYNTSSDSTATTADFLLRKRVTGINTTLATEAVDLTSGRRILEMISCSGSTIKAFREDMVTPKLTVTDTDLTSGSLGYFAPAGSALSPPAWLFSEVLAAQTKKPKAYAIAEVDMIEKEQTNEGGEVEKVLMPNLPEQIVTLPDGSKINKLAVTWGTFDHKKEPTAYLVLEPSKNIVKCIDELRAKNKKIVKANNYDEIIAIHNQIKQNRDMIAGKDNLAYHFLGDKEYEYLSVADFYEGFMQGTYNIKDLERVQLTEVERMVKRWVVKLKKSNINSIKKEKHIKKLLSVLKK